MNHKYKQYISLSMRLQKIFKYTIFLFFCISLVYIAFNIVDLNLVHLKQCFF